MPGLLPRKPANPSGSPSLAELVQTLPGLMAAATIPGLGIAVVHQGEVVMDLGLGVTQAKHGLPVTCETIFEAASLSKPVFAYATLQLVEAGKLDLDRPLTAYIPYDQVEGDPRLHAITARQVLSHSSGLPNWRRDRQLTIDFDPGSRFCYSGEGFDFLQKVVERQIDLPLEDHLRAAIFEPLGMTSSSYVWQPDYNERFATGHDLLGASQIKFRPREANAGAGLHTTAGDFALFLREMMHPTLLSQGIVAEMLTPQIGAAAGVWWGLGWGLEELALDAGQPCERFFWHWGDNEAFRCLTVSAPQRDLGVVYFTNSENGLAIANDILRHTVGGEQHPALTWQDYGEVGSSQFRIERTLLRAGLEGGAERVQATYNALRCELPADAFTAELMNLTGTGLQGRDALEAAIMVFRLNEEAFPDSWEVYDNLGEALMRSGQSELAIGKYEKCLLLNPDNGNARALLEQIRRR